MLVEVKAVEAIAAIPKRQLSTHLRLGDFRVGLLLNLVRRRWRRGSTV